jgi:hypothetical protein
VLRGFLSVTAVTFPCPACFAVTRKVHTEEGQLGAGPDKTVFLASATRQPCACSFVGACRTGHLVTVSGMGMQGPACLDARLGIHALTHMQSLSCNLYRELA